MREMTPDDYEALCLMLKDEKVMYAYAHAFDDTEVQEWLNRQLQRYKEYGFGLWAVILKETEEMIGQCGLTMQECRREQVLEIGYLFQKEYWHQGYAAEAANACKQYAFNVLQAEKVYSIIRDSNMASQHVAIRNGMKPEGEFVKRYYGMDMPHIIFSVDKKT